MNPALLLTAINAAGELIRFIQKSRATLQQSAEWTPEQEAAFDEKITKALAEPHWQPDQK